ncbi:MAG: Flp pilus assembly protein CpaB [Candidatus Omnitrophota bacterium]
MAIEKQKLILISGVVLGIVAIVMTKMYLDQQQEEIRAKAKKAVANMQANQVAVLVAKKDIPVGVVIDSNMLETAIVPNQYVQPQAVTSLDRIAGMITIAPIAKDEQVSLSKLVTSKKAGGGDLSGVTPAGKRAISIVVDNISSLSGMIRPNDYVDVLATIQVPAHGADGQVVNQMAVVPLFQNILVLAVGSDTGGPASDSSRYADKGPSGNTLITLALGPQESNLIAFVQEQGKIRLIMRSPADAKVEQMPPASWDTLFQYIAPQQQFNPDDQAEPVDTTEYVEVLRGLNKEKIPISK